MTSDKQPLQADDVAKRVEYAIVRALKVLMDIRQQEGHLYQDVRHSRFLTNAGDILAAELVRWDFDAAREPPTRDDQPVRQRSEPDLITGISVPLKPDGTTDWPKYVTELREMERGVE